MHTVQNDLTYKQRQQLMNLCTKLQSIGHPSTGNDEMAFIVLMRICRDYANPCMYSFIKGKEREQWLIEKLNRFRIKYFEPV